MKSKLCCLIALQMVYGCIKFDGEIPIKYRKQINHYRVNDTLYYKSNFNDLDTIIIKSLDSISIGQGPDNLPFKRINLRIEHLPNNRWFDGIILSNSTKKYDSIKNQKFVGLYKEIMQNKSLLEIGITFRDFSGSLNFEKLEKKGIDTIKTMRGSLNDTLIPDSVMEVYWSKEKGMIGYKKKDGQVYNLE